MEGTLKFIATAFLALFAGVWLWVAWKLWQFDPTTAVPKLVFTDGQAGAAGLMSSAVASATAAVLGIEIQKARTAGGGGLFARAVKGSRLLKTGIATYLVVGLVNFAVWFPDTDVAPEMIAAFCLGLVGWMAGAFSAVFQSSG
jgi:hypothetical protein